MHLDYTGEYENIYYKIPTNDPLPQPLTHEYLSVGCGSLPADDMYWHFGFFNRPYYAEDKYFFTTNLMLWRDSSQVLVCVTPPSQGYSNYRFRNVEGYFDTTFTTSLAYILKLKKGEGYLYEVAPIVKYGGKLIYPETISTETTLIDEMVIQNGATLTVNSIYNVDRDIKIKAGGSIVSTNGGTLKFYAGSKLIIEGAATIAGTASQKLILDFLSPENSNGIIINQGGSLTTSYCEIKNASTGIFSARNANYLNAQNVNFINCSSVSINILGRGPDQLPTSPSQIKYCNISNSITGISVALMSEIIIQQNTLLNTELGIFISEVTSPSIVDNVIQSNLESMEGIFASSVGGVIRGNTINGHTVGIHLANSSPDIGGNHIYFCKYHGMYIGTGSNPNMRGRFAKDPKHVYAISGYNEIKNNGGYEGESEDNDGSEIYFNESDAIMREGCNSILDDREPEGGLINTILLMNGSTQRELRAEYNYWGHREISNARFGHLTVYYDPYYTAPCSLQQSNNDDEKLITKTSNGEVIDTLYPSTEGTFSLQNIELLYSTASELFVTGDLGSAEYYYDQIINTDTTLSEKKEAYTRKYEIGKMLNRGAEYFSGLRNTYLSLAGSTSDSLLMKVFNHLSSLCYTAQTEYVSAIGEYDEIIQQNPNTEEAVYAEIDAITNSLLVEGDSTLHKGKLGKYLVKSSEDYNSKIDEILRKHFGNIETQNEEEVLPTEYTLYQNYPNPFNPTTIIKYDLPNASDVSLIIYDILGRKVKELVNTKQEAGRYEIQFNASNIASGVYIYQLIVEKYMNAKKMILLK